MAHMPLLEVKVSIGDVVQGRTNREGDRCRLGVADAMDD